MLTIAPCLASVLLAAAQDPAPAPAARPPLEVRFLANEGFLLRAGDDCVLLDAFLEKPYSFYGALPEGARDKLLAGEAPLAGIDVALVSHAHGDHLQTAFAARFFESAGGSETRLVSSPQVVDAIAKALGPESPARERLVKLLPEPASSKHWEHDEIRVELLRLPHGGARWKDMHQIGHVIEIGGFRVLHLGDADSNMAHFTPHAKLLQDLDVCFVPYWYFDSEAGRELVAKSLEARLTVAMHVPPVEVKAVREKLARSHPGVVVFERALDSRQLE